MFSFKLGIKLSAAFSCLFVALMYAAVVAAEAVDTRIVGAFAASQENGCMSVSLFFYKVDCSYENAHGAINDQPIPWVGPTLNAIYYPRDGKEALLQYIPVSGDARLALTFEGEFSVDRRGTGDGSDDQISGEWAVGPASRNLMTRTGAQGRMLRVIESWRVIRHTLERTPVSRAEPNEAGGFDYILAAKGFPLRLCRKADSGGCFPSADAALLTDGKWGAGTWASPSPVGVGRSDALGGNPGARTTAEFVDYACIDNSGGTECRRGVGVWGAETEDPGWDNLLLRVRTDKDGRVLSAEGYWTQEFRIGAGPPALQAPAGQDDSWWGGYFTLGPINARAP